MSGSFAHRQLAPYVQAIYNATTYLLVIEHYCHDEFGGETQFDRCQFPAKDEHASALLIKFLQRRTPIELKELGKMLPELEKLLPLL